MKKTFRSGFVQAAYNYGEAKNAFDPGSIASGSWTGNQMSADPNNPGLSYSINSPGHRFFISGNYRLEYFNFGATAVSVFWETRTIGNTSYIFSGDANGDSATGNDLIYIPRNTGEMNFQTFTAGANTFTAAQQAAAWETYISQDRIPQPAPRRVRRPRRHVPALREAHGHEHLAGCVQGHGRHETALPVPG